MPTATMRIPVATQRRVRALAEQRGESIGEVVAAAISRFEEEAFWAQARAADERMRTSPAGSAAFDAEVAAWDGALKDGLPDERREG